MAVRARDVDLAGAHGRARKAVGHSVNQFQPHGLCPRFGVRQGDQRFAPARRPTDMRRLAFVASALVLVVNVMGSAQPRKPAEPAPGRLVEVNGRSLHIRCVGPTTTGPTVILEAGAGDYSNRWTAVQDLLARRVRSCAYDRAGLGWSAGAQNPSFSQSNLDLRALLTAANVTGPYVLVGHSIGALLVRRYASHHPDAVVGMVLVGPTHENTRLFFTADSQWKRVREQPDPTGADFQELHLARQANPTPLGDRPLIVVVGTRPDPKVSTPDDVAREKATELEEQPRISRNSKLVRDPSSGHHVHVDNPTLVADAIEEVVTAAIKGTKVTGDP
jgi:pimeloyl-ACP methyl ester carboxylesterase